MPRLSSWLRRLAVLILMVMAPQLFSCVPSCRLDLGVSAARLACPRACRLAVLILMLVPCSSLVLMLAILPS
jgi:hypothetical protein